MSALRFKFIGSVAAVLAFAPSPVFASDGPGIEGIDAEKGETEIEVELRIIEDDGTGLELQLQGEHALNGRWSVGGEVEFEREAGEAFKADTALARIKWRLTDEDSGFAVAVRGGAGYSFGERLPLVEAAIFVGWSSKGWSIAAKADVETLLGSGAEPEFGYRIRLLRDAGADFALGAEAAGSFEAGGGDEHRIGPFVQLPLGGDEAPVLELGVFAGLNRNTPDLFYRIEVEFEF